MRTLTNLHYQDPTTKEVIVAHTIDGDCVYGIIPRTGECVYTDVQFGMTSKVEGLRGVIMAHGHRQYRLSMMLDIDYSCDHRQLVRSKDELERIQRENAIISELSSQMKPKFNEVQERYLATLLAQQISADHLRQGTKALTGKLPPDVKKGYLGGWILPEGYDNVEELVESISEQGK